MSLKKGEKYLFNISKVAFGGKGISKVDGLTVFVDNALPMDIIDGRIIKKKKSYAVARIENIIDPSPFRTDASCKYSGFCGGCKWQFLIYDKQLEYKREFIIDSLEHIGLLKNITVHPVIPSKNIFGYRNKMEFSCSDRRWLLPEEMGRDDVDNGFAIGLHAPGTFYKIIDIDVCLLQPDLGNHILSDVRKYIKNSDAPAYGLRSHTGFWRFLMLRHSAAFDQWMVNIITAEENRSEVEPLAKLLTDKYPEIVSVINNITSRKSGVAIGEYEINLHGTNYITDKIGDFSFEISSNSFFQTNTSGAKILYDIIKKFANLSGDEIIFDFYSGTGTISIYLSAYAKKIIGFEIVESSVADAKKNSRLNNVKNCIFIAGDLKNSIKEIQEKPDIIIIDPPRSGMHKDVVRQILEISPQKIIYVSCNPATMARDLSLIKDDYIILEVQPVDMFPHTYHIESVALLEKKGLASNLVPVQL